MQNNKLVYKSWIEISKKAFENNLNIFRSIVGKRKIFAVVKANAYGHDLVKTVRILEDLKCDMYAVDNLSEALQIREIGVRKPVLILGYTPLGNIKYAVENDFSITVYSKNAIKMIKKIKLKKIAKVHLKLETGLNRQGLLINDAVNLAKEIAKNNKRIFLEGVSTHFTDVEDTANPTYSKYQLKNFNEIISAMTKYGIHPKYRHCACSAAAILYPSTHFDAVRIGISLYGMWPSKETKISSAIKNGKEVNFMPALTWKSIIAQVKVINKGESVGYGRTWRAGRKSKIAIIPVGYSDGFDRSLSNIGRVIIKNAYAPIIGRVAMNMIMVDVTDIIKVQPEDVVIIIGRSKNCCITADEIAQKIGTINYEIVSRINPLLKRIVKK